MAENQNNTDSFDSDEFSDVHSVSSTDPDASHPTSDCGQDSLTHFWHGGYEYTEVKDVVKAAGKRRIPRNRLFGSWGER